MLELRMTSGPAVENQENTRAVNVRDIGHTVLRLRPAAEQGGGDRGGAGGLCPVPSRRGERSLGLRRLRDHRKEWDEGRGLWKDRFRHSDASHGADAFLTFACSGYTPPSAQLPRKRDTRWVV